MSVTDQGLSVRDNYNYCCRGKWCQRQEALLRPRVLWTRWLQYPRECSAIGSIKCSSRKKKQEIQERERKRSRRQMIRQRTVFMFAQRDRDSVRLFYCRVWCERKTTIAWLKRGRKQIPLKSDHCYWLFLLFFVVKKDYHHHCEEKYDDQVVDDTGLIVGRNSFDELLDCCYCC